MARRLTIDPWDASTPNPLAGFGVLQHRERYDAIFHFLIDEAEVRAGLAALAAAATGGPEGFGLYLQAEERRFGFSATVQRIGWEDRLLKASLFWTYLLARKPLFDVGAGPQHGAQTHRVQWVLVGQWNDRARRLGAATEVAELYRNLALGNARHLKPEIRRQVDSNTLERPIDTGRENPFESVWDALFDPPFRANASFPEYLHAYIQLHFPTLFEAMRA